MSRSPLCGPRVVRSRQEPPQLRASAHELTEPRRYRAFRARLGCSSGTIRLRESGRNRIIDARRAWVISTGEDP